MTLLQTLAVAFSMFSAIPMPQFEWNSKNMRYVLCAFPLVGVVCAVSWLVISFAPVPQFLRAALFCVCPVIITGGIHLDGYADTCDALSSRGDCAKKQQILSDPHCGAFAVIRLCIWFIIYFALCFTLNPAFKSIACAGLGFILSRVLSGWSVTALDTAKNTGLVHAFSTTADKKKARLILTAAAAALAAAMTVVGSIAGLFLQKCELWQLAALVSCQLAGAQI